MDQYSRKTGAVSRFRPQRCISRERLLSLWLKKKVGARRGDNSRAAQTRLPEIGEPSFGFAGFAKKAKVVLPVTGDAMVAARPTNQIEALIYLPHLYTSATDDSV